MITTIIIIVAVLLVLFGYGYYSVKKMKNMPEVKDSDKITVLTNKNFQQQIKKGVMLVDFWASWCMPCKMMAPVLNEIAEEPSVKGSVGKLNVEHYQNLAGKYGVRSIPTMVLFKNGKEINRFVGVKSKSFLLNHINNA